MPDRDLVKGVEQGMAAYFKFVKKEKAHMKKIKPRRSMWEGTINPSARDRTSSLRRGSLTGNATMMKISEKTMIREELMSLPEFKPVFIRLVSLIQFLLMAAMVLYSLLELQFGKFGITNVGETCRCNLYIPLSVALTAPLPCDCLRRRSSRGSHACLDRAV